MKCPKCKSDCFDEDDCTNYDLEGSCDVRYKCNECDCLWSVGLFQKYTDDEEILEEE